MHINSYGFPLSSPTL